MTCGDICLKSSVSSSFSTVLGTAAALRASCSGRDRRRSGSVAGRDLLDPSRCWRLAICPVDVLAGRVDVGGLVEQVGVNLDGGCGACVAELAGDGRNIGGRGDRVETQACGGNVDLMPIELTDEMKGRIDGAFENETPIVVAYVDGKGTPHLSFRGTTQVLGDDRLAFWARSPDGGLPSALDQNPQVALLYRDPSARRMLSISGRARVAPELNDTVYERSPERERARDPERRGVAIVVDLDHVMSAGSDGVLHMQRD